MSYLTGLSREEAWGYIDRHIEEIPLPANRLSVRRYLEWKAEIVKFSTLGTYLSHIKTFGIYLGARGWKEASWDDVFDFIRNSTGARGRYARKEASKQVPMGAYSKYQRMVMLRDFYKWILDEESPVQFRKLPFRKPTMEEQSLAREDRLRQEELMGMIRACTNSMDRSLVVFLMDSGYRASEVSQVDVDEVELDEHGAKVQHKHDKPGLKSGPRRVATRLVIAAPSLQAWLADHPNPEPGQPLFVSMSNRNRGERLSGSAIWSRINQISKAAGIRHIRPHMFRHTAASLRTAQGWPEEMMRIHFGWSKGSPMPSYYSHVDDEYDVFALDHSD